MPSLPILSLSRSLPLSPSTSRRPSFTQRENFLLSTRQRPSRLSLTPFPHQRALALVEKRGMDLQETAPECSPPPDSFFGLTNEELHPDAPFNIRWREQNPLCSFRVYLTGQILCVHENLRVAMIYELDKIGWPLHLRTMDSAAWSLTPGSPWPKEDEAPLLLLRKVFKLPSTWIAPVFFEGRTAEECEEKLFEIMGDQYEPAAEVKTGQQGTVALSARKDSGHFASEDFQDQQNLYDASDYVFPPLHTPTSSKRLPNTVPVQSEDRLPRLHSETPYSDHSHKWEDEEKELLVNTSQNGMTAKQIWQQYFPGRSMAAVQSRLSNEKKKRGIQTLPRKWHYSDREMLVQLANDGLSYEEISAKYIPDKTPKQCATYHQHLLSKVSQEVEGTQADGDEIDVDDEKEATPTPMSRVQCVESTPTPTSYVQPIKDTSDPSPSTQVSSKKSQTGSAFLQQRRSEVIQSIERAHIANNTRTKLKNALNKHGWPKRFTSVQNYHASPAKKGAIWVTEDSRALMCILDVTDRIPFAVLAEKFFTGRTENAVRNHYRSLVKAEKAKGG